MAKLKKLMKDWISEERRRRAPGGDEPVVVLEGLRVTPRELDQILREIDGTTRGLPNTVTEG
jgi:hypothetical protein